MQQLNQPNRDSSSVILMSILLAGLMVRLWGFRDYVYSGDEMLFLLMAAKGQSLAEVWRRGLAELHPPLMHFIRHYLLMLSPDIFTQRLFSMAAGMATIVGFYRFGSLLRGSALGLFCAGVVALMPVAVVTSVTIRNYAFFMAFTIFALCAFVRYRDLGKQKDLTWYSVLIFLASAIHFSGFFVAAACGITQGIDDIRRKRWKPFALLTASYLPLLALGLFLHQHYLAPGTAGPMWHQLAMDSGFLRPFDGSLIPTIDVMFAHFFYPLIGLMRFKAFLGENLLQTMLAVFAGWLATLQIVGLCIMYKQSPRTCYLVLWAWFITIFVTYTELYPNAIGRHGYYLFPFFVLPFGYALNPVLVKILASRRLSLLCACVFLAWGTTLAYTGVYTDHDAEFGLKQADLNAAQQHLHSNLKPGDVIVTGRLSAYFYLLNAMDDGRTAYDSYGDVPYFNHTMILAPFDPPWKPHSTITPFRETLQQQIGSLSPQTNVWFVMYNYKNIEQWMLMECDAAKPYLAHFFSRDGAIIYSINARALMSILNNDETFNHCYAGYKPLIVAMSFKAVSAP